MKTLIIDEKDNVCVCLEGNDVVPTGHKMALKDIKKGEFVIKYGNPIGRATEDIKKGDWVHSHNLKSHLDEDTDYSYDFYANEVNKKTATFKGFKRINRRAGIRNEIYIIPTVGCVNNVCLHIEKEARKFIKGSIDGIYALTHQFGCSQLGDDNENIKNLLCAISQNPNASFVLFVGLGCENNGLDGIKQRLSTLETSHIRFMNCQDETDDVSKGLEIVKEFIETAKDYKREDVDFSELCIGLKCGGSDGFSGITANPLVGKISDRVVALGGSAILSEVPEMFGAEQILMNKCVSKEVFEKYKKMIVDFKKFYTDNGFPVYENPSPGNKKGGITTLEEKSLGCIQKAGTTKIVDVLGYAELVKERGVSVLDAPGNDLIASTAIASAGCQIVLFTTGRGTPFSTFVPTMKIGTNDHVSTNKNNWIDFNAYGMEEDKLFDLIQKTVNGENVLKSEDIREIAFYKKGVTL